MTEYDMMHDRVNKSYAEMARIMNTSLYGDEPPPRPKSRWRSVKRWFSIRGDRVHDAWLVLTGQAEIGGW